MSIDQLGGLLHIPHRPKGFWPGLAALGLSGSFQGRYAGGYGRGLRAIGKEGRGHGFYLEERSSGLGGRAAAYPGRAARHGAGEKSGRLPPGLANAEENGGWDLVDLWNVDDAIADDMLAAAHFIRSVHSYPDGLGLRHDIAAIWQLWRGKAKAAPAAPEPQ